MRTEEMTGAADTLFYRIKDFLLMHQQPSSRNAYLIGVLGSIGGVFIVIVNYGFVNENGQDKLPARVLPDCSFA